MLRAMMVVSLKSDVTRDTCSVTAWPAWQTASKQRMPTQCILTAHIANIQDNAYLFTGIVDVCLYGFVLEHPGCAQGMSGDGLNITRSNKAPWRERERNGSHSGMWSCLGDAQLRSRQDVCWFSWSLPQGYFTRLLLELHGRVKCQGLRVKKKNIYIVSSPVYGAAVA